MLRREIKYPVVVVPKRGSSGAGRIQPESMAAQSEPTDKVLAEPITRDRTDDQSFNQRVIMRWEELKPKLKMFVNNMANRPHFAEGFFGYSVPEVNADIQRLINRAPQRAADKTEAAITAEYGLAELIKEEKWFGLDVACAMTSQYDDSIGVDFVIRFVDDDGRVGFFSVDVKTNDGGSRANPYVASTIAHRNEELGNGNLKEVKYLIDPVTQKRTSLLARTQSGVPHFVLVFDTQKMMALRAAIGKQPQERRNADREKIAQLKRAFTDEIRADAKSVIDELSFKRALPGVGKKFTRICEQFERIQQIIK